MRRLRITAHAQLRLVLDDGVADAEELWWSLPEEARHAVVALLARLIARGLVSESEDR